jgi:hypothetical protein
MIEAKNLTKGSRDVSVPPTITGRYLDVVFEAWCTRASVQRRMAEAATGG